MPSLPVAALSELLNPRNAEMASSAGLLGFVVARSLQIMWISLLWVLVLLTNVCLGRVLLACNGCGNGRMAVVRVGVVRR